VIRIRWAALVVVAMFPCAPASAGEPTNAASSATSAAPTHQAVERSISYLQTEATRWLQERKCSTCHHVPMAIWSLAEARRQGYAIDEKVLADVTEATLGSLDKMVATVVLRLPATPPDPRPFANGISMGAVYLAVGAGALPSVDKQVQDSLALIANHIVDKQRDDGSWEFFGNGPPIAESQATDAAWTILALEAAAARSDASESTRAALAKAKEWLARAKLPDSHQAQVVSLLMEISAGKSRDACPASVDRLMRRQNADGGWSQTAEMPSDAYATGQTLYALSLAGLDADLPEVRRAIAYLVSTQAEDGTWPMTSRPTRDGKSPGATSLVPITYAGTAWATLGLVRSVPR